jgi:hypothetical protein
MSKKREQPINGGPAIITFYRAVVGTAVNGVPDDYDRRIEADSFTVRPPGSHAQHETVVNVLYEIPKLSGKRRRRMEESGYRTMLPTDIEYCVIIGPDGAVLYDSRTEVPCDMA